MSSLVNEHLKCVLNHFDGFLWHQRAVKDAADGAIQFTGAGAGVYDNFCMITHYSTEKRRRNKATEEKKSMEFTVLRDAEPIERRTLFTSTS